MNDSRTLRVVLNLTPDELADLASAVVVLRERRVAAAEAAEIDADVTLQGELDATRLAERARTLQLKLAVAIDRARNT